MFATPRARLAVICLLLTTVTVCDRKHDSEDFLPTAPGVQKALQITSPPANTPLQADGISTLKFEVQISPDANVSRKVRFHTTLGGWLEPEGSSGAALKGVAQQAKPQVDRDADNTGKASAILQSEAKEGIALVTISVIDKDEKPLVTVSREVPFTRVTGAIELTATPADPVLADGVAKVTLEARISASSPPSWNKVIFETTRGAFNNLPETEPPTPVTVPADPSRIARVDLRSSKSGTATVTAKIEGFEQASVTRLVLFDATETNISIDPQSLEFGQVPVNSESDMVLLISNTGSGPLKVDPIGAPANAMFTVQNVPATGFTVSPGGTRPVTVRFKPTEPGEQNSVLFIASDDPQDRLLAVELSGEGVKPGPNISVDPPSVDFGEVKMGEKLDKVLTIRNTGDADLKVFKLENPTNDRFTVVAPTEEFTLVPGGTRPVTLRFEPDAVQSESGLLNITSEDPQDPVVVVELTGAGVAP